MSNSSRAQDEGLVRVIGVRALGISIVNLVVGAGIFVLPGLIAVRLGAVGGAHYPKHQPAPHQQQGRGDCLH